MNERQKYLIKEMNKMGVFYQDGNYIEELALAELEYYHITKKCEMVNVMIKQKGQPAPHRLVPGEFIPFNN